MNKISRIVFLSLLFSMFFAQKANAIGVDDAIQKYFTPFVDKYASAIFSSIKIFGTDVPILIFVVIITSIFCTFFLKGISIWGFVHGIKQIVSKKETTDNHKGEVSSFGALATALSGTVGMGNIAGVAIAISVGGPGAIFWMWFGAIFGMALKFCEVTLALIYRRFNEDGSVSGGPMYYMEDGFAKKGLGKLGRALAYFFAFICIPGTFGGGCMLQSNQAAKQFILITGGENSFFYNNTWVFGLLVAIIIALVIVGGIKSIAKVTSRVVPIMCILYIITCVLIILFNYDKIPHTVYTIVHEAFYPQAVAGGIIGSIIFGIRRSIQSNEAGIGASPMAYAAVKTNEPASQGFISMLEPFFDTVIVCSMTAFVIIITEQYLNYKTGITGVELTSAAFESVMPIFPYILAIIIIMFALSTTLSWAYYGQKAWAYLFGDGKKCIITYQLILCSFIIIGSAISIKSVIDFTDATYLLMATINLIAIWVLRDEIKEELIGYCKRHNLINKINKSWFKNEQ